MSTSTTMSVAEAIEAAKSGQRVMVLCPAHDDRSPSLAIAPGNTQPIILTCHAGCTQDDILDAAGITYADICNDTDGTDPLSQGVDNWTPAGKASHIYPYLDEDGKRLFEVLRVPLEGGTKTFRQRKCVSTSVNPKGHEWNMDGVRRVPYRLPHMLLAMSEGHKVSIVEGEKCAHLLLRKLPEGEAVTCNPGGAGKWEEAWGKWFSGAQVDIYADGDDTGRQHARAVRESIIKFGGRARILEAPTTHDVGDHIEAGLPLDQMLETTPESMAEKARTGIDIHDMLSRPVPKVEWAIEGTMAKGERFILVAGEGFGKTELLRQIGVMTAAGMHPFSGREIPPKRVLFIDAENHPSQTRDSYSNLVGLCARHGHPLQPGMLTIMEEWDGDHDFTSSHGKAWLEERIYAYRPDLVILGPLTNVVGNDLKYYEPVDQLRRVINASRRICNSAIIMEHHAPKRGGGDKVREWTPYGSGLFMKWPDFGFALAPTDQVGTYEWDMTRGPRVRGRQWPAALRTGKPNTLEFPWESCEPPEKGR